MIDLNFLNSYLVPIIIGICLCVGYIIKSSVPSIKNNHIPLIMAVLGILLNVWLKFSISPEIILSGMFSGLASTGLHQAYKNLIGGK